MRSTVCVFALLSTLSACAPAGYHYETGSFTPTPNDPCWRKEFVSTGGLSWVNSSVGKANGVPSQVKAITDPAQADSIQLSSIGLNPYANVGGTALACHVTLNFVDGTNDGGVLTMSDPGAYAPIQVFWLSDEAIALQRAAADRLTTSKNLLVKPDLATPAIQRCVGRQTALGAGEQFPGQLWAACSDKLGVKGDK